MSKDLINLDQVVREWAWKEYDDTVTSKQRRLRKKQLNNKNEKFLDLQIDWSSVKFVDETKWSTRPNGHGGRAAEGHRRTELIDPAEPTTSILFETKFVNNSDDPQQYTMRTEKTTRSSLTTTIESGLTKGVEMGVKLTTPCEMFEVSAGFKREVTLANSEGESFEEELTWGVDSVIQVQGNEVAEACLVVNERKQKGRFTIKTRISGTVYASFTDVKDNNSFLKSTGNDISDIVKHYLAKERNNERELSFVEVSGDVITVETVGQCNFRYGVSQEVKVNKRPITAAD